MLNLAHYVQCHPSFRYLRVRHKQTVATVFVIFCVFFMAAEWFHARDSAPVLYSDRGRDDQLLMLRAQVGYLKRKLAKQSGGRSHNANDRSVPVVYAITPTYARPEQKAQLTRLCHTFLLAPNLHWIVVEDAPVKSALVSDLLAGCGVAYTHLHEETPSDKRPGPADPNWVKPRGVVQRNAGLYWLRDHFRGVPASHLDGAVYFADDDNTYSLELFEEMRTTERVSVWPVGLVGGLMVEKPKLSADRARVVGWDVTWAPNRPFAIDMAGFAVNLRLFLSTPKAKFSYQARRGFQESEFLKHLTTMDELEPKADGCTRVLVWHTRNERVDLKEEAKRGQNNLARSDHGMEV